MRVTQQSFNEQVSREAQSRTQEILRLQQQLTTGLRIERPSDDPGAMGSLLGHKAIDARMEVDLQNISTARSRLGQSNSHLRSAVERMRDARDLALEGVQSQEPRTVAQSVNAILEQMLNIANSTEGGGALFAGTSNDGPAYEVTAYDAEGRIAAVAYAGSNQRSQTIVGPFQTVDVMYSGEEVFRLTDRGETSYFGDTGARPGTGSDTGSGDGQLLVQHTSTQYFGIAGVAAGASSVGGDTVIGERGTHNLTITDTGSGQTVSLNGGVAIAFDATSTDLAVTGPNGAVVHVDLSAVAPTASGNVEIEANGTISNDGGATSLAIDFSNNQQLISSTTGEVTNVDTANVTRTGTEDLSYVGSVDVFEALIELRDLLESREDFGSGEFQHEMSNRQADIDRLLDHMLDVVGEQAVDLENLDWIETRTQEAQLETRIAIGDVENADLTEVILQLQTEQTLLEYVYATAAGSFDVNLLDFLR